MSGIVTAYQPHYYPRLHYLARAQQADVFVIYDDVQFARGSPQHRAPIEYQGLEQLTIPVKHTGDEIRIDEARLDPSEPWPATHLRTLRGKYGSAADELAPFYERLCPSVLDVTYLRGNAERVADLVDDPDGRERVERCLALDERWRERKWEFDEIRGEKKRIEGRIAERKREDPSADIGDLVSEATEFEGRLGTTEGECRELRERRDRALVSLSLRLDRDAPVDWMAIRERWSLKGIDSEELMGDVGLVELTVPLLLELLDRFNVESTVVRSSELDVVHPGDASEYLARLTEHLDGDCYLSGGVGYENYFNEEPFDERGFDVLVQDWSPIWEDGNVCALDVLFGADDPSEYIE